MALSDWTFDIRQKTEGMYSSAGSYGQGGSRQSTQSIQTKYFVTAIPPDPSTGDTNTEPEYMNEHYIGCLTALPTVMGSVYYDSNTGLLNPYAICMNKTVRRNIQNPYLFEVEASFKTKALETENCTVLASDITNNTDISPEVTVQVGNHQKVLYQDLFTGDQSFMYQGIKERFESPVTTDIPNLTLNISQYEFSVSYAQILARSYVTNSSTYSGYGPGMWLCKVDNVSNVVVQTSSGPQTWARVTYSVSLSQDGYYDPSGSYQVSGWKQQVPLIASKFLPDAAQDDTEQFMAGGIPQLGMINQDGTKATNQEKPDYLTFNRYRSAAFSFLQV